MRVLHGPAEACGQPSCIAKAQREQGIQADTVAIGLPRYHSEADCRIHVDGDWHKAFSEYLASVHEKYDVFHFYTRSFFHGTWGQLVFPTALDLLALRAAGKVVIFHNRGSEVRIAEKFKTFSPYHYVTENPNNIFTKLPAKPIKQMAAYVKGVANEVLVPDVELQSYLPYAKVGPRAIDMKKWPNVGVDPQGIPHIVHAPSQRVIKGTDWILQAVEQLRQEGLEFKFTLVEGMTNSEAAKVYRDATIVVDQMRIGWHGVLAVECMALGKAVVSYIREDLEAHLGSPMPLVNANRDTLTERLRELIQSPEQCVRVGQAGRAYCEQVHAAEKVAGDLIELYRSCIENPTPVDLNACLDFIEIQRHATEAYYRRAAYPWRWRLFRRLGKKVLSCFSAGSGQ